MQRTAIRPLGEEDMSYMPDEAHEYLLWECMEAGTDGAAKYMLVRHFDVRAPQNHNVRYDAESGGFLAFVHGGWQSATVRDVLKSDMAAWEKLIRSQIGSRFAAFDPEDVTDWVRDVVAPLGLSWSFCTWIDPCDTTLNPPVRGRAVPDSLKTRLETLVARVWHEMRKNNWSYDDFRD